MVHGYGVDYETIEYYSVFSYFQDGIYHWLIQSHDCEPILCHDMGIDGFWKLGMHQVVGERSHDEQLVDTNIVIKGRVVGLEWEMKK